LLLRPPGIFFREDVMSDSALIIGLIVIGLSALVGLAGGIKGLLPRTPCAIGDTRWGTQQKKNDELEKRLETGTRAFDHVRAEIRKGLDELGKENREAMAALGRELRGEMRRIEDKSIAGDKGLQELSKDLVNAVTQMQSMTKAIVEANKG
jgi:hypothetical protein